MHVNKRWCNFSSGVIDPVSLTILGFLVFSFIVGTIAVVQKGSLDLRNRAATIPGDQLYPVSPSPTPVCLSNGQNWQEGRTCCNGTHLNQYNQIICGPAPNPSPSPICRNTGQACGGTTTCCSGMACSNFICKKYNGVSCSSSSECISNKCSYNPSQGGLTCQSVLPTPTPSPTPSPNCAQTSQACGSSAAGINCCSSSNVCFSGKCLIRLNSPCSANSQCTSGICGRDPVDNTQVCLSGNLKENGESCTSPSQCKSGRCTNGTCVSKVILSSPSPSSSPSPKADGNACTTDKDCISNNCSYNPSQGGLYCQQAMKSDYSPCTNNSECLSNQCFNSTDNKLLCIPTSITPVTCYDKTNECKGDKYTGCNADHLFETFNPCWNKLQEDLIPLCTNITFDTSALYRIECRHPSLGIRYQCAPGFVRAVNQETRNYDCIPQISVSSEEPIRICNDIIVDRCQCSDGKTVDKGQFCGDASVAARVKTEEGVNLFFSCDKDGNCAWVELSTVFLNEELLALSPDVAQSTVNNIFPTENESDVFDRLITEADCKTHIKTKSALVQALQNNNICGTDRLRVFGQEIENVGAQSLVLRVLQNDPTLTEEERRLFASAYAAGGFNLDEFNVVFNLEAQSQSIGDLLNETAIKIDKFIREIDTKMQLNTEAGHEAAGNIACYLKKQLGDNCETERPVSHDFGVLFYNFVDLYSPFGYETANNNVQKALKECREMGASFSPRNTADCVAQSALSAAFVPGGDVVLGGAVGELIRNVLSELREFRKLIFFDPLLAEKGGTAPTAEEISKIVGSATDTTKFTPSFKPKTIYFGESVSVDIIPESDSLALLEEFGIDPVSKNPRVWSIHFTPEGRLNAAPGLTQRTKDLASGAQSLVDLLNEYNATNGFYGQAPDVLFNYTNPTMADFAVNNLGFVRTGDKIGELELILQPNAKELFARLEQKTQALERIINRFGLQ